MRTNWQLLCISLITLRSVTTADEPLQRFSRSELHMGVEFEVVLYAADAKSAEGALAKGMQRIAALDKALSDYDLDSELSQLSQTSADRPADAPPPAPVKLSDELWTVLLQVQEIGAATDGAFDVTIGPLSKLWRRARRWKELPELDALAAARASVGFRSLTLDAAAHTAQLLKPDMRLDLGGIAKGYAADEAVKAVVACGISRVLARASGDISVADPPPGEPGWRIGIAPLNPDDPPTRFVHLANCGISTSGDARQHLIVNGRRYSHILDPRTGNPITGRSSVTIIARHSMLADGLATAASVLGPDASLAMTKKLPRVEILMVCEDEAGQIRIVESPGFKNFELAPARQ